MWRQNAAHQPTGRRAASEQLDTQTDRRTLEGKSRKFGSFAASIRNLLEFARTIRKSARLWWPSLGCLRLLAALCFCGRPFAWPGESASILATFSSSQTGQKCGEKAHIIGRDLSTFEHISLHFTAFQRISLHFSELLNFRDHTSRRPSGNLSRHKRNTNRHWPERHLQTVARLSLGRPLGSALFCPQSKGKVRPKLSQS